MLLIKASFLCNSSPNLSFSAWGPSAWTSPWSLARRARHEGWTSWSWRLCPLRSWGEGRASPPAPPAPQTPSPASSSGPQRGSCAGGGRRGRSERSWPASAGDGRGVPEGEEGGGKAESVWGVMSLGEVCCWFWFRYWLGTCLFHGFSFLFLFISLLLLYIFYQEVLRESDFSSVKYKRLSYLLLSHMPWVSRAH